MIWVSVEVEREEVDASGVEPPSGRLDAGREDGEPFGPLFQQVIEQSAAKPATVELGEECRPISCRTP
ncbi:hypothetical protein BB31_14825 [Amycolatopsis lurida NRRL 2430]|uniref:Uncharacterized protein n=1 Tax=Amycolatopsis lurida NRRL 2430 TaxID=1460371 RepID=A0A2P2FUQ8_AMYLU|nr:hypothetical protein BB31_14825 [Amycolatopsis lurida NRRL 2430]